MVIYYKGVIQAEVCIENPTEDTVIQVVKAEIKNLKEMFPGNFKDNVFNVFLDKQETLAVYGKNIAVKSAAFFNINETTVTCYITTYHYAYPKNIFYDGDIWFKR